MQSLQGGITVQVGKLPGISCTPVSPSAPPAACASPPSPSARPPRPESRPRRRRCARSAGVQFNRHFES